MLGAQGLWAGRDLYRATPAVTRGLDFSGLIRRSTAPFSRLLRHTRGCGGSILTRILTGPTSFETQGNVQCLSYLIFIFYYVIWWYPRSEGGGDILVSVTNFRRSFLSNYTLILTTARTIYLITKYRWPVDRNFLISSLLLQSYK
jgi:hypothetical protein